MSITVSNKIIKVFESFVLGYCKCGCNEQIISIRSKNRGELKFYNHGHCKKSQFNINHTCVGRKGSNNYNWKGGEYFDGKYWFIKVPDHPFANYKGYIKRSRYNYEQAHNCILLPKSVIHHKDKNTQNDSIDNLQPFVNNGLHIKHTLIKDRTNTFCYLCNKKTRIVNNNKEQWFKYRTNYYICFKCYRKNKRCNKS